MAERFSQAWYRVAEAVPRLRSQARIFRHVYRGAPWYLVQDLGSGKFLRLNAAAYQIVALIDGYRSLEEIWQRASEALGESVPTQDEVIHLVAQLHQANVLIADRLPDIAELEERRARDLKTRLKQYFANPMALRFPLLDPDRFLARLVALIPRGVWPVLLAGWFALIGYGVFLAAMHWEPLTRDISRLAFSPEYIGMLFIVFPLLKALHEIGHGIAIKAQGGQCHEMGLMLLVLMPIPYVDASHSTGFRSKYRRMLVAGAGMLTELGLAAIALYAWTQVDPGLFRVFLQEVVLVAGASTLLFNINPLLRLDGYYILSDALEIPNLGQRANRYFGYTLKRHLLRVRRHLAPPALAPGEAPWLWGYAVLSFAYRMFLAVVITLFVAGELFFVGVILAGWAIYMMILLPLAKTAHTAWNDPAIAPRRPRLIAVTGTGVALVLALLFLLPAPSATRVDGVVWLPAGAEVHAPAGCFGAEVLAGAGPVAAGQPLLRCADPLLEGELRVLEARRDQFRADLAEKQTRDTVLAENIREELAYVEAAIADIKQRLAAFLLRSPRAGEFVPPGPRDFAGRYFTRGEVVGHVIDGKGLSVLAAVSQQAAERVAADRTRVGLRLADAPTITHAARVIREVPAATRALPSLALTLEGGGDIGLDPQSGQQGAPLALEPFFLLELAPRAGALSGEALGQRVHVRIGHSPEPLGVQLYRVVRDLFLERFMI